MEGALACDQIPPADNPGQRVSKTGRFRQQWRKAKSALPVVDTARTGYGFGTAVAEWVNSPAGVRVCNDARPRALASQVRNAKAMSQQRWYASSETVRSLRHAAAVAKRNAVVSCPKRQR